MKFRISLFLLLLSATGIRAQFTVNSVYGNFADCDTMSRGIFLVWWDKDFSYGSQVDVLLDSMLSYRDVCLNDLQMLDPPNPLNGYYYNIYIHTPGNAADIFNGLGWANGQGTDSNGYPFLTLPNGVLTNWVNNAHEGFHIFQYNANSPGYAYSGNSQWYIEGSANWFAAKRNPGAARAFVEAEALVRVPQVPLWLSYGNYPANYPQNWQRYVHQYASALLLYYLTDVEGVSDSLITVGFFNGTNQYPQEFLFNTLGASDFRDYFLNWAAHMTNHFDFITPQQAATNEQEWNWYADPADDNEFTGYYQNTGSGGWVRPHDSLVTTAWSFNTFKVRNGINGNYLFELNADGSGSQGSVPYFDAMVVVQNSQNGATYHPLNMTSSLQGSLNLSVAPSDTALYFIIASMPQVFGDFQPSFQTFSYEMRISEGLTARPEPVSDPNRKVVGRYNLLGQPLSADSKGMMLLRYDDGSFRKVFVE